MTKGQTLHHELHNPVASPKKKMNVNMQIKLWNMLVQRKLGVCCIKGCTHYEVLLKFNPSLGRKGSNECDGGQSMDECLY